MSNLDFLLPVLLSSDFMIDIVTQYTPNIHLDTQKIITIINTPPELRPMSRVLKALKPRITIQSQTFGVNKVITPYGDPQHYFPLVIIGVIGLIMAIFSLGYFLGSRTK